MPSRVHVATAQLSPRKGDYLGNLERLGRVFAQIDALSPRPMVLSLPEVALTGYFLEGGVREHSITAGTLARDLDSAYRRAVTAPHQLDVVVGFYERFRGILYNSALYVSLGGPNEGGRIRHVHRKLFLPTYGLFDEERFVERGRELRAFDTPWGRAAVLVCEDAWHGISSAVAALDGAQVIFVCSAAPARGIDQSDSDLEAPASVRRWDRLLREIADQHGVFVVLSNMTGSEGGKMFPGGATIYGPAGDVRGRGPLWDEAVVTATLDFGDILRARADAPLIGDLAVMVPHLRASLTRVLNRTPHMLAYDGAEAGAPTVTPAKPPAPVTPANAGAHVDFPVVESDAHQALPSLEIDAALAERWLVTFIKNEMARRGMKKVVIGMSGGVDSAVSAALAVRALGPENVIGVRLPYKTSSPDSLEHAQMMIDMLGIEGRTLDITAAVDGYFTNESDASPARRGNVMARVRMLAVFDLAAKHGGIPLGTGNKTERLLGYFTWHGDDAPPLNPLGDLFKTQIWALAKQLGVPTEIVGKAPSADLVPGQTDEGDLGISYARADAILSLLVAGYGADEIVARGFGQSDVETVRQRLEGTHWKRRLATVAMVSSNGIGEGYLRPVDY